LRCLARRPENLAAGGNIEVVAGDVLDPATLPPALDGAESAYYLIHSLSTRGDFEDRELRAARNFAAAAGRAGVRKIIYLGGLGAAGDQLSKHLRSRQQTGDALREPGVPVIELRASVIIGSGSLSFEIIRALVERLPVMTAPRWVRTPTQPIAIDDVISYLIEALECDTREHRIYEIGGRDQVSYGDIMLEYARQRGLRRWILPVPVLTPKVSSLWLTLVTPAHARVGQLLIEGLRNPTLVRDRRALKDFSVRPMGIEQAVRRALYNEDHDFAQTRWSDALSSGPGIRTYGGVRFGSRLVESRTIDVDAPPARAFAPIRRIGGAAGWYYGNWMWRLRGLLDKLAGGVGLRRGRKNPEAVRPGDTLDFWRVEDFEPDRRLRLLAEMRLPGRAWLEFEVTPAAKGGSTIRQTAIFDPIGLAGLLYWYALYPLHGLIFGGMLRAIARRARSSGPG
jgi:uncharacterized protein YbjT (DUF2867 family)